VSVVETSPGVEMIVDELFVGNWWSTRNMFSGNRPAPCHAERIFFSVIATSLAFI
jgi:hypothetical protein